MSNALKTILYMGSLHGFFTFYLPYQLASRNTLLFHPGLLRVLAVSSWILGVEIILQCSVDILRRGGGTPAHLNPPKRLMIKGWYHHIRNPIYVGALLVQAGYIMWFGSAESMVYAVLFFLAFHFLVIVVEEPILRNAFGAAYEEYCQTVPRWVPGLK